MPNLRHHMRITLTWTIFNWLLEPVLKTNYIRALERKPQSPATKCAFSDCVDVLARSRGKQVFILPYSACKHGSKCTDTLVFTILAMPSFTLP
eukprot:1159774-Pelagomonas_calceolata.AAC.2